MHRLFCIMGKSASGKDTIFQMLLKRRPSLRQIVPYTTRPRRTGETDGFDYHFVTDKQYAQMQSAGQIIEARTYQVVGGEWHYFTADDGQIDLEKADSLMIGTLEAYCSIRQYFGAARVVPLYIDVDDNARFLRAFARERAQKKPNYPEMCRRYLADLKDFSEEKLASCGIERRYVNEDLEKCCAEITHDMDLY